jgi:hypothetical protein
MNEMNIDFGAAGTHLRTGTSALINPLFAAVQVCPPLTERKHPERVEAYTVPETLELGKNDVQEPPERTPFNNSQFVPPSLLRYTVVPLPYTNKTALLLGSQQILFP